MDSTRSAGWAAAIAVVGGLAITGCQSWSGAAAKEPSVEQTLYAPVFQGVAAYHRGHLPLARATLEEALNRRAGWALSDRQYEEVVHILAGVYWRQGDRNALAAHADTHLAPAVQAFWSCMVEESRGADDPALACWQHHEATERSLRVLRTRAVDDVFQ